MVGKKELPGFVDGEVEGKFIGPFFVIALLFRIVYGQQVTIIFYVRFGNNQIMNERLRRMAINRAEVKRRCKLLAPICQGVRAHREGLSKDDNPYEKHSPEGISWWHGWNVGQEKKNAP